MPTHGETLIRTQVQLTSEQMRALKDLAAQEGRPVAELVRRGVDALLRDGMLPSADRWARAASVSGRFRSARRDLARRHDEHFAAVLDRR